MVDDPDPGRLTEAIAALSADQALRARLIRSAQERARADFSIDVASTRLGELLNLDDVHRCGA